MPHKRKLSEHDRQVFDFLCQRKSPFSAYDILGNLQDLGIKAPTTIYRSLKSLSQKGLIHKIESLNAYIACCDEDGHTHEGQFLICVSCGLVEEFFDQQLKETIDSIGNKKFARFDKSTIELSGLCHACKPQTMD